MKDIGFKSGLSVLIPDGESSYSVSAVCCLAQTDNIKVYVVSKDRWTAIRFSRYIEDFFYWKGNNDKEWLDYLCQVIKNKKIDIVLPLGESAIRFLSIHQKKLGALSCLSPLPMAETFDLVSDKGKFAAFLKKNNLPHPATMILDSTNKQFDQCLRELKFPVLIKPVFGEGGRCIRYFDDLPSLLKFILGNDFSEKMIIQSFIQGYDIDCSVLCESGEILAFTIQKGFIKGNNEFAPPSGIKFLYDEEVHNVVKELMYNLKWSGIAHIDLRYDEQKKRIKIVEINPRYWTTMLGSLSAGINFPFLACLAGMRINFPCPTQEFNKYLSYNAIFKGITDKRYRHGFHLDETVFHHLLYDPLPYIIKAFSKCYKKLSNISRSLSPIKK